MGIQQNTHRIRTTHVGSLPRPKALLDLMAAQDAGETPEPAVWEKELRTAVEECVRRQAECGIDILTDGEQSKPGFFSYVRDRLEGFEPAPHLRSQKFAAEVNAFPEYYEKYFKEAMMGGCVVPTVPLVCRGPIRYKGEAALQRDIQNLQAAASQAPHYAVFMPSVAPSGVGSNEYYKTEEEFFHALAAALRHEYRAIVDAGFLLQIDDPFLSENFGDPSLDAGERHTRAAIYVEAINEALRGIPAERVRLHTCYGINEGPRIHEAALAEVARYMLKVNVGAYSFEAANPRHEHEYHLWETLKLPEGKVLIPGVITHACNIVEHPELIAERLLRFAKLVGRENVLAGADCGFSSQATYNTEVHPKVVWAKFDAMREGAALASKELWR
jgi:5-methyltetrahydropteroyltriglutamate--homocysteine methyltransferase